ncbi:MAG TPA: hypothetical protein DIC42_07045 [Holosporales bacterium]|nr:hypothetical protein [Holosporales bacterium]
MKNFLKFLSIFVLFQTANASDPIDYFKAGTLRVNLDTGFTKDDAFSVLSSTLRAIPKRDFTIDGFADDSWHRPGSKGELDSWLQSVPLWNKASFLKLCDFAFGINSSKQNKKNTVSYDAVIYLKAFMQQHFQGEISEESKALDFAEHVLDCLSEQNMVFPCLQHITFNIELAKASLPFFCLENMQPLQQNFSGFLRSFLFLYNKQKLATKAIPSVWVHHYLEHYFGQTRSESVLKSDSYENLAQALKRNIKLLGFNAESALNPYNALVAHYDYLRTKRCCSAQRFFDWGDMLVSGQCNIGLAGEQLSDSQKIRECAHYLFRCAWELPKAKVLLAETIIRGVMLNEKGGTIDNRQNPNAHFEHAARILRDVLSMRGQDNYMRAKAFDQLALLVLSNKIHVDENNKPFTSLAEGIAFCRRAWKFTLSNAKGEKRKYLTGLKLLNTYMKTDVLDADASALCVLLAPLYNIDPFAKSQFLLTFGQLAMQGKWSRKKDDSVLRETDRARYAFECFEGALAELDKLTSDIDKLNIIPCRSLAKQNMARVLVKHPDLFPLEIQEVQARMEYINELLTIPTKAGLFANFSQEDFNATFSTHVVRGLALLNIASDVGKAVEEFRMGALKGEYSAYEHYMYHTGIPSEGFFDEESSDDDEVSIEDGAVELGSPVMGEDSLRVQPVEEDQMQQAREMHLAALNLAEERENSVQEKARNAIRNADRKAEKRRRMQERLAAITQMPLAPVTDNTKPWEIKHFGKAVEEYKNLESNPTEQARYMTLLNAIQLDDKTGKPETLTGVCLSDGTPILTRRFSRNDRMVYSLSNQETNPVLTIYGLKGHDDTVLAMLRTRIAGNKR